METHLYLKTLTDLTFRMQEQDRLLLQEPIAAFLNTLPKEIRNLPSSRLYIEKNIVSAYDVFKLEDNKSLFSGKYDFVYDQKSGYGAVNLGGHHSFFMTSIWFIRHYKLLGVKFEKQFLNIKNLRDASILLMDLPDNLGSNYLDTGDGFFLSSMLMTRTPQKLQMSEEFRFKNEKHIFKDYVFNFI